MSRSALRTFTAIHQARTQVLASTSRTLATAANPSSSSGRITNESSGPLPLTWPAYLSARRSRKLWSTLTSIPSTFAGLSLGGGYFASIEVDASQTIMGIDPIFAYGGATIGCMALGYLVGPTIGSILYSATHPSLSRGSPSPLEVMDKAFYDHIKANRASPAFQSVNNPAPDFYGEKVTSLSTYRRWLRDQAAYTRKAMHGVPEEK